LIKEGCDGQAEAVGSGADGAAGDAVARAPTSSAQGASCAILGDGRAGRVELGCALVAIMSSPKMSPQAEHGLFEVTTMEASSDAVSVLAG